MQRRKFNHLSLEERERILGFQMAEYSMRQMAKALGRDVGTISREFKRNAKYDFEYIPCRAHRIYCERSSEQRRKAPLKSPAILLYVREHLRPPFLWSPERISGRLKIDYPNWSITPETIYNYIYSKESKKDELWQYLPKQRKKRRKQTLGGKQRGERRQTKLSRIKNAVPITKRPRYVEKRKSGGHFETDNAEGNKQSKSSLSVTVERCSRKMFLSKLTDKRAQTKAEAVKDRLLCLPSEIRKTITADNGSENTKHEYITKETGIKVFFCTPYHSWEKGSVENAIGVIRRFVPKGSNIDEITEEEIEWVENWYNNLPMKCLMYKTPNEKMQELLGKKQIKSFN